MVFEFNMIKTHNNKRVVSSTFNELNNKMNSKV